MRRYSQRHNLTTLAELNVTPLLDLAFVLLIIFMITTPLMEKNVDLQLPSDAAARGALNPSQNQTVSITRDGTIKLNTETVTLDQLQERLAAMRKQSEIAVIIRSHKDLPVQKLIDVMAAVQRAGIAKLGVVTNPEAD